MSCGFGAVVLLLVLIAKKQENEARPNDFIATAISQLQIDLERALSSRNTLNERLQELRAEERSLTASQEILQTQLSIKLKELERLEAAANEQISQNSTTKLSIISLESQLENQGTFETGNANRSVSGDGQRQYLTGLRVGGERILILLDSSSSMLDTTVANIAVLRNLPSELQQNAPKWLRAKATLNWLISQLPLTSQFQIYHFNETVEPALEGTRGRWLPVGSDKLNEAADSALKILPSGGTNLELAFQSTKELSPPPDNIIIITDGLPTLGSIKTRYRVTESERRRLFRKAVEALPPAISLQIILLPLEGDPLAASLYWKLATERGGSFITPSEDWP